MHCFAFALLLGTNNTKHRQPNQPKQTTSKTNSTTQKTVVNEFCREARAAGVDIFRVFDSLNYLDNLKFGVDAVRAAGGVAEGTICYTGDLTDPTRDKYTLDYYLDLAERLVDHGVHSLGIKDMAGLLKPRAATTLVSALRARHPDLVIHVHTHDSAGTGVATQLAAAAAGADIVDAAVDSMSGLTSQPSLGAIVAALQGTELDTGIDPKGLLALSSYWEATRELYAPFESNMRYSSRCVCLCVCVVCLCCFFVFWVCLLCVLCVSLFLFAVCVAVLLCFCTNHHQTTHNNQYQPNQPNQSHQTTATSTSTRCPAASTPTSSSRRRPSASAAAGAPCRTPTPPPTAPWATSSRSRRRPRSSATSRSSWCRTASTSTRW